MTEPAQTPELAADGDPTLGPDDLAVQIHFRLVGKERVVADEQASLRLSHALSLRSIHQVTAAIQSQVELLRQSTIIQMSQAILSQGPPPRPPRSSSSDASDSGGSGSGPESHQSHPGDPSLGFNDLRLTASILLLAQQELLSQNRAEAKLSQALAPMARGAAAAAVETAVESLVRNALAQLRQSIEKRFPKEPEQPKENSLGYRLAPLDLRVDHYGTGVKATAMVDYVVADTNYEPVGVGYFGGAPDTKPDIVWRNKATGHVYIWHMDNAHLINGPYIAQAVPTTWKVGGVADMNGDGVSDIVWHNEQPSDGMQAVWYINGGSDTCSLGSGLVFGPAMPLSSYTLVGVGYFNTNAKPDFLWRVNKSVCRI